MLATLKSENEIQAVMKICSRGVGTSAHLPTPTLKPGSWWLTCTILLLQSFSCFPQAADSLYHEADKQEEKLFCLCSIWPAYQSHITPMVICPKLYEMFTRMALICLTFGFLFNADPKTDWPISLE